MSEKKSTHDWAQDWQALQSQYWSAWSDATRRATGQAPPANTPWHEGMEQWSRMFGESGKQSETADRLMSSAKNYVALMQSMLAAASAKNAGAAPMQAWTDALRSGFNLPGVDAALLDNPMAAMLKGISGQGAHGFDAMSETLMPFLAQARQEGMSWLQAPAFGYAREHQEHYQKMLVAFAEYQEALKHYNALILKSSQRSFGIFEDKLAERSEPGRQIDSMRALYDLWVDSAEEAYAEIALSDEFRKVYGDVVNAQTRVRAQIQQEIERVGTDLGMPTRSELNSVHKRLHELRRKFHDLNASDSSVQVEALRAEVQELRQALARGGRAAPVSKSKPVPKTHVARTAKAAPARKRAAAVAKPASVSRRGATTFSEAISSMRSSTKPAKAARARRGEA
ncbi:MAG: class III poly(R)-hydroxyalkanoic acid synthase subunit PhaE [Rudaea sp.]|nr:class III poly(R)-hydroxyalkanoic acid synthase subunit PhaE [Rudaea sp.]